MIFANFLLKQSGSSYNIADDNVLALKNHNNDLQVIEDWHGPTMLNIQYPFIHLKNASIILWTHQNLYIKAVL